MRRRYYNNYRGYRRRGSFLRRIIILAIIFGILLAILRANNLREIDDVSPGISCNLDYLNKSNVLWVVPKYQGKPISENKEWCKGILAMNKTIGMHGVTRTYREFEGNITQAQLSEAMKIFEDCFGYPPKMFKAPQLKISMENRILINKNNLILKGQFNQATHKVYHCDNSGKLPNWFHDLI